ncbi:sensor histidine kinase [Cohnella mopanensis]|uniref:sensor histidine kinase n=1 Tax=Cohnella mopanensis TaxID=2911966 RepID=UPI001EF75ACE|nr:sensor histidine kinase [Cohnella mopanensis]
MAGRQNLRFKLLSLLVFPLSIFLITTVVAIVRMSSMTDELTQSLYVETYQSGKLIENASNNMNKALVAQRTLIFTDYKSKKYQSIYEDYKSNVLKAKENTELAKTFILQNEQKRRLTASTFEPNVPNLIDKYFNAFEQWETRSNTIIESMSTRGLRGDDKLVFQGLILDEAIAADEKFNSSSAIIKEIETILGQNSVSVKEAIQKNKQQLQFYLILIAGLTFAIAIAISLLVSRKILNSIMELVHLTKRVARGDLSTDHTVVRTSDEIGLLTTSFISMCKRLSDYINIVYISKLREKEAELRSLQLQIQPHFLFNTLEVIRMKAVKNGEKELGKMVKILADIYRWNVKGKSSIVSLEEELEYTLSYMNLQEMRFQDRLRVLTEISSDVRSMGVPKLIIQPLIENAISHGFNNKAEHCVIRLAAYRREHDVVIECTDNGDGMEPELMSKLLDHLKGDHGKLDHIGLKNVHSRISILFGEPYGVTLQSIHGKGSTITLTLPAQTYQEMRETYVEGISHR